MFKRLVILSLGISVLPISFCYASYLFLSSSPTGATIRILEGDGRTRMIGKTPLKLTNFSKSVKMIFDKVDYFTTTNTIPSSQKIQSIHTTLSPFSFDVQILDQEDNTPISANGKIYAYTDDPLSLPYGHYEFKHNLSPNMLNIEYKSPYIPYVAFFSTITILSTVFAITGGLLASRYFKEFQNASSTDELVSSVGKVATWDTVTWSSVGIGTGALIGTIITSTLEVRDQKRIKRFNGMNTPSRVSEYFSDFQEIMILSSLPDSDVLKKIDTFIRKYPKEDSSLLPDVYLRRAGIYMLQERNLNKAIIDLKIVMEEFPARGTYELAAKLLGDLYSTQKRYKLSYDYYTEALKVRETYNLEELQRIRLQALYLLAEENNSYRELFLEETTTLRGLSSELQRELQSKRQTLEQ
ncbi:MAG: tetratricopeptide repeat protein [Brevinema sp.]